MGVHLLFRDLTPEFLPTVEFSEREWKFRLGSEFATIWGNDYGSSRQTCTMLGRNSTLTKSRRLNLVLSKFGHV